MRTKADHEYRRRALLAVAGLTALFWGIVGALVWRALFS